MGDTTISILAFLFIVWAAICIGMFMWSTLIEDQRSVSSEIEEARTRAIEYENEKEGGVNG